MKSLDYLIVGQGLAGSLLAWELMQRGCRVEVVDNQAENASKVAAGLINPVTGMRWVKQPNIEALLPTAKQYYQRLEHFFKQDFYVERPMLRLLRSEKEKLKYQQRLNTDGYSDFLAAEIEQAPSEIQADLGVVRQKQTAYVLIPTLLACLRDYFQQQACYHAEEFDYEGLVYEDNQVCWQNRTFQKVIFCEGYRGVDNPWFKYLPFQLAKGEILSLSSAKPIVAEMLNYGRWFIPLNSYQCRIGATFEHECLNTDSTVAAKDDLLAGLLKVMPDAEHFSLDKQQANIRPTTLDKAPFIGCHPNYVHYGIFNGFGAKGSLYVPFYSQQFADYLLESKPLDALVDCQRYDFNAA